MCPYLCPQSLTPWLRVVQVPNYVTMIKTPAGSQGLKKQEHRSHPSLLLTQTLLFRLSSATLG